MHGDVDGGQGHRSHIEVVDGHPSWREVDLLARADPGVGALPDTARHIDELLERARESDAAVAASAAGATYAGEADPYRKPHEPDELDDEPGDEPDEPGEDTDDQ